MATDGGDALDLSRCAWRNASSEALRIWLVRRRLTVCICRTTLVAKGFWLLIYLEQISVFVMFSTLFSLATVFCAEDYISCVH